MSINEMLPYALVLIVLIGLFKVRGKVLRAKANKQEKKATALFDARSTIVSDLNYYINNGEEITSKVLNQVISRVKEANKLLNIEYDLIAGSFEVVIKYEDEFVSIHGYTSQPPYNLEHNIHYQIK